jgi:hypothetical protein
MFLLLLFENKDMPRTVVAVFGFAAKLNAKAIKAIADTDTPICLRRGSFLRTPAILLISIDPNSARKDSNKISRSTVVLSSTKRIDTIVGEFPRLSCLFSLQLGTLFKAFLRCLNIFSERRLLQ